MNTEAKVGVFTLVALFLFAFIIVQLNGIHFGAGKDYQLNVVFNNVTGLRSGNMVKYSGVDVGRIDKITADSKGATVRLLIQSDCEIPRNSVITIGSDGIMGEKFISIIPAKDGAGADKFKAGDTIIGAEQRGIEELVVSANAVLSDIQLLVRSMNKMFGDEAVQSSFIESSKNIKEMTVNMNLLTAVIANLAANSEGDVRSMIGEFRQISENMNRATAQIASMLAQVDNNGQTARDLCEALANLTSTSRRIENMAASMEGVVTDPQTADDLKATLSNVRNVSDKANTMLNKASAIKIKSGVDVMYSGGASEYKVNADTRINFNDKQFLLLGINDLGETNKKNLQLGSWDGSFGSRAGLMDDKVGIGIDAAVNDAFNMSLDAYNPNDFKVKLRASYRIAPETYIVGESDNINRSRERETFVGLRRTF